MARIIKTILVCYFMCFSIYTMINLNKINTKLENINIDYKINIKEKSYYNNKLLTNDNYNDKTNNEEEYLLYFHQDNCDYCLKANVLIDKLINKTKIPIYFLTPDKAKDIYNEKQIESTPSLIYIKDNKEEKIVGLDEVNDFVHDYLNNHK